MDYLKAIGHSSKQKEKVLNVNEIIDRLWCDKKAKFSTGYGEKFEAVFTQKDGFFYVVLSNDEEAIGFAAMKDEGEGRYSIVNDSSVHPHPGFAGIPGYGLVVKEKYRKRGFGAALLSLCIGVVQQDFKEKKENKQFEVLATDITRLGLGSYKNFGFQIKDGLQVTVGHYLQDDKIPEIVILQKKVPKLKRFIKRLGLGKKPSAESE